MTDIHPTTITIVAGLLEQRHEGHHLALKVQQLAQETCLVDAKDIAEAGLKGWDLGYRQQGERFELTARSRDDPQFERLITAMVDRKNSATWSYYWLISREHFDGAGQLYPNDSADSFNEAMTMARVKIDELRRRS